MYRLFRVFGAVAGSYIENELLQKISGNSPLVFCEIVGLQHFAKFAGKHLCQGLRDFGTGVFQ